MNQQVERFRPISWAPGVTLSKPSAKLHAIGPIVETAVRAPSSPLFYGYEQSTIPVRWATSTLCSVAAESPSEVLLRFKGTKDALLSGEFLGIEESADRPAIIRAPVGRGQVLLFMTNPMFRHQNVGEYRLLYNAIVNYGRLAPRSSPGARASPRASGKTASACRVRS